MKELLYIFLGGGAGSVIRYLTQMAVDEKTASFPWGTFIVNTAGSLLIGLFYSLSERFHLSFEVRLFLTVGFCGGFTTFSTFSHDMLSLLKGGFYGTFASYLFLSIALGIGAVLAGIVLGKHLLA